MACLAESKCEPCSRSDVRSEGFTWCSDCEEILCETCDRAHRIGKLTLSHHLVDLKELPPIPLTLSDNQICEKHTEKAIESYCIFHDEVCCRLCMTDKHRTCGKLLPLEEVAKDIKSSALVEDISKVTTMLLETLNVFKDNRKQNKEAIIDQEKDIKAAVTDFKQSMLAHLNQLEESLLSDLMTKRDGILSRIEVETEDANNMIDIVQKHQQQLEFALNYGSKIKLFLLLANLKPKLFNQENKLTDMLSHAENTDLTIIVNDSLASALSALAKVSINNKPCEVSYNQSLKRSAQIQTISSNLSFEKTGVVDLSRYGTCSISHIEITDDSSLLLCHYFGRKILMYTEDGYFIQDLELSSGPYGIACIPNSNEAVVTFSDMQLLSFIGTENLNVNRTLIVSKRYYGVQVIDDAIILGSKGEIDILSMDGQLNRTINLTSQQFIRFIHYGKKGPLLATNSSRLFSVSLLTENLVFQRKFSEARGIATDMLGNIYIVDKKGKSILRYRFDGTYTDTVLNSRNGIGIPLSLKFSRDFRRLFVGSDQTEAITVFTVK